MRSLYTGSGPKESQLTIRGDGDQDPVASEEVCKGPMFIS